MNGMRTLRTIGAVALSAAVGLGFSGTAHALKFVNAADTDPGSLQSGEVAAATITYAKETLVKAEVQAANETADKTVYYKIGTRNHFVAARPKVGSISGDTYVLTYKLEGMVFSGATYPTFPGGYTRQEGGAAGDNEVVYRANSGTTVNPDASLAMTAQFAVSAEGGSVTLKVENRTFGGDKTLGPVMIKVMPALKVTAKPTEPAPQAKAAGEFMNFGGTVADPTLRASLGTFELGVSEKMDKASGSNANNLSTDDDVTALTDITVTPNTAADNPVTFSVDGGFGFVKTLALAPNVTTGTQCAGTLTEIRKPVTPATTPPTYTDETTPQAALSFVPDSTVDPARVLQHLCVEVDGETSIPKTGPFMVMATFKGLAGAAFPPMAMTSNLASITRDGTQFNIPILTDDTRFKQRITIQNRGRATTWSLTDLETVADSVMPLSGMGSGALPKGQTVIKVWEHIDVTGGSRASGSITIPLASSSLTATMDILNPESGSIGVTTLTAE